MSDVKLDDKLFYKRAGKIFDAWEKPAGDTADLEGLGAIQVLMGDSNDESLAASKTSAVQVSGERGDVHSVLVSSCHETEEFAARSSSVR